MLNFVVLQEVAHLAADTAKKAAPAAVASGIPVPPKAVDSLSLLDMILKGGYMMIPLVLLSIIAIYFIVERLIVISKATRVNGTFMANIKDAVLNGHIESARMLCKSSSNPVARMVEKGISRIGQSTDEIEGAMETVGKLEVARLEKNMGYLSLIAKLAPMFGFVGTILGVIKIFYDISLANNVEISTISSGLYQKMTSSAGGLIVGIIAFIGYYLLSMKVDKAVAIMEKGSMEFMDVLHEPGK